MSRKLTVTIAIVSSLMAVASSAVAGQTISDKNYWPSAVSRPEPKAALASFAFDNSGPQSVNAAKSSEAGGRYFGGPHPR